MRKRCTNSMIWKWRKLLDNGKIGWDLLKRRLEPLKMAITSSTTKSRKDCRRDKEFGYNSYRSKTRWEIEWRINKLKDIALRYQPFSQDSENLKKPEKSWFVVTKTYSTKYRKPKITVANKILNSNKKLMI